MAGAARGGAEAFFERLSAALPRYAGEAFRQSLIVREEPDRVGRLSAVGLAPETLPFGGTLDLRTPLALRGRLKALAPDVVLTWMNRATGAVRPGPYVFAARLGGYYKLKYYKRCDHLIGNTPGIVTYLRENGWPEQRTHYLPNFADASPGTPLDPAPFGTPPGTPVILALGRLHENKAFDVLIAALGDVPDAHLWLAGEGPLRPALEAAALEGGVADRVRFLGWRRDIADLLASATVLACPSRHEPLGNVILEAWAHGVPVVAAASDGPRHLITPDETGRLVPVDDAKALGEALCEVLNAPAAARAMADAGRLAYDSAYSEAAVAHAYLDFFKAVMRTKTSD
ncbi:MAG: glycosyltransferase [Pseudomonadota bacterium]